jgi:hypothetical protein
MGSRSKGGYKLPGNNDGRHWLGQAVRLLVLTGRRHRRYQRKHFAQVRRG